MLIKIAANYLTNELEKLCTDNNCGITRKIKKKKAQKLFLKSLNENGKDKQNIFRSSKRMISYTRKKKSFLRC